MAKISSSQPPRKARPAETPSRQQRTSSGKAQKVADAQKGDKDAHGSQAADGEGQPEAPTLGEALGKERELREELKGLSPGDNPWENAHTTKEDKERAEELRQKLARVQKPEGADGAQKGQGARQQGQQAGRLPGQLGQLAAGLQRAPGGGAGADGFERMRPDAGLQTKPALTAAPLAPGRLPLSTSLPPRQGGGAVHVLNSAQEPGVYFKEDERGGGGSEEDEDPELAAAVEEAIRLLFGVRGIHRVGPGQDEAGQPVIVVAAGRGFSQSSMSAVPEQVHRFRTLVAVPYELLPLRRDLG